MATDITRQLCASAYYSPGLRERVISYAKNPYNAVVAPPGLDMVILLKHALNARQKQRNFYYGIFALTLIAVIALVAFFPLALICGLVIFIAVIVRDQSTRRFIKESFTRGKFDENFAYDGPGRELVSQLQTRITRNIVFYSGYSPFVGCGVEIGGWSFVVDIDKGKKDAAGDEATPKPFLEDEMYYNIVKELTSLKIENFNIENKIYFNGKKIREKRDILPNIMGHPITEVPPELTKNAMNSCVDDARYYKMIQVTGWDGDLILMAFLRVQKGEKTLFVENNYFLLPPIREEFRIVDKIKQHYGIVYFIRRVIGLMIQTVAQMIASVSFVLGRFNHFLNSLFGLSPEARLQKLVRISPDYDYGSASNIRHDVCQANYFQHFQKLDKERYFKTIDKRILNGIANFLDSKNISTEEFREREATVLNNGIIVNGGNLTGNNFTAGKGSFIKTFIKNAQGGATQPK